MKQADRNTLNELSINTFTDNNSGDITPDKHRNYNEKIINAIPADEEIKETVQEEIAEQIKDKADITDIYTTTTKESIQVGSNAKAGTSGCSAVGRDTVATGTYSSAYGYKASAIASYSLALGYQASATKGNTTALGYLAASELAGSIALGYNSKVFESDMQAGDSNTYGVFSVGNSSVSSGKRRIINVKDGRNETDAATVGQITKILSRGIRTPLSGSLTIPLDDVGMNLIIDYNSTDFFVVQIKYQGTTITHFYSNYLRRLITGTSANNMTEAITAGGFGADTNLRTIASTGVSPYFHLELDLMMSKTTTDEDTRMYKVVLSRPHNQSATCSYYVEQMI